MAWHNDSENLSNAAHAAAIEAGRNAGAAMAEAIEEYTTPKFRHFRQTFLETLRNQLQEALRRSESSPVTVAKQKFDVFRDQVAILQAKLEGDAVVKLADWIAVADQSGVGGGVREILRKRISIFGMELVIAGKSVFDDYAIPLRDAEAAWQLNRVPPAGT